MARVISSVIRSSDPTSRSDADHLDGHALVKLHRPTSVPAMSYMTRAPLVRYSRLPLRILAAHSQNFLSGDSVRLSVMSPYFVVPGRLRVRVSPLGPASVFSTISTSK